MFAKNDEGKDKARKSSSGSTIPACTLWFPLLEGVPKSSELFLLPKKFIYSKMAEFWQCCCLIFSPPMTVALATGDGKKMCIATLLTMLFYIPGLIYAINQMNEGR
ncbi:unnamed protein product, partial [Mesorhabditis spiculigera]